MKSRLSIVFASLVLLASMSAPAQTNQSTAWTIDPMHSQADFQISHLGVSTVRGSLGNITGTVQWDQADPSKSSVVADIDASTVNTATDKRNDHLKSADFFNVAIFPKLRFQSTSVQRVNGKLEIVVNLTMVGVTKPVTLEVDGPVTPQKGQQGGLVSGLSATGNLKRSDFNFGSKFAPPFIGDEVKFTLDIEIGRQ